MYYHWSAGQAWSHDDDEDDESGSDSAGYDQWAMTSGHAEAFRLVKIRAHSALANGLECEECENWQLDEMHWSHLANEWFAYGADDLLYCSRCWQDFDPESIPCQICDACPQDVEILGDFEDEGAFWAQCRECYEHKIFESDKEIATNACADCGETDGTVCGGILNYVMWQNKRYCMPCYEAWAEDEPPLKRLRGAQTDAVSTANEQRNEANRTLLKEAFPNHCDYHLYFRHVRGTRSCEYGDADKCVKGSHAKPDGLDLAKRGLDLNISH